jgi:hypothetical protein
MKREKAKLNNMIFRMATLVLQPGDLVVLQTDLDLDNKQANDLQRAASARFKPYKVIIITHGMKVGVLRKAKT